MGGLASFKGPGGGQRRDWFQVCTAKYAQCFSVNGGIFPKLRPVLCRFVDMDLQSEIKKAIGAHGMWKGRLKTAIHTGKSEATVAVVCQDNQCEFGKWLYALDPKVKAEKHWQCVKGLHADFHKEAGSVLGLALAGKKAEAESALTDNSKFNAITMKLTMEMMAWASGK